jgi:hypothetical protein
LSKSKSHLQQHSLFSFVVDGKHIVDEIGTKPWDRLPVLLSLTLYVHYPFNRSRASSDATLGIVLDVSTEFVWRRSFVSIAARGNGTKKTCEDDPTTGSSDVTMAPPVASLPKENEEENQDHDRKKMLLDLAPFCDGIAIPLKGGEDA